MAYIFGLKQANKMGLSLLHSPLTATSIRAFKSSGTGLCWLMQTLFQLTDRAVTCKNELSLVTASNLLVRIQEPQ